VNPLKKLTITAAAAIPAVAMFAGIANAAIVDHVVNGTFNANAKGWTVDANATLKKHDGYPIGVLTNDTKVMTASTVYATQCVALDPGSPVTFSGRALIPANQERSGSATFFVGLYHDKNCTQVSVSAQLPALTDTSVWKEFQYKPVPFNADPWGPGTPGYARVSMVVEKSKTHKFPQKGEPFMAFFDDIKLTQAPLGVACLGDCGPGPVAEDEPQPATSDGTDTPEGGEGPMAEPVAEPVEPVSEDPPAQGEPLSELAEEPAAPGAPQSSDEPVAPSAPPAASQGQTADEPAPAAPNKPNTPAAPATGSTGGTGQDSEGAEAGSAETSEQYELSTDSESAADRQAPRGSGAVETISNLQVPGTNGLVGASELGMLGGALAFFGLVLAVVAMRRERSDD
jgi:hypothetical protein